MESQRYVHDCSFCQFLGQYKKYDLYVCPAKSKDKIISTVVARFGSDGPDYISGIYLALHCNNDILKIAIDKAIKQGWKLPENSE